MAEESDQEKTESASARRIEQAREEGHVPQSRELSSFLVMMAGAVTLLITSGWMFQRVKGVVTEGLSFDQRAVFDPTYMLRLLGSQFTDGLVSIAPMLLVLIVAAVAGPLMVGGMNFSSKAYTPDFTRLNPLSGIGRILSLHGAVELVKSLLKSFLIGGIGMWVIWKQRDTILALISMPLDRSLATFGDLLLSSSLFLAGSLAVLALIDVPFQIWQYFDKLKMSKEELKQEFKEQEGDPQIKGRIRARQREMARRRMMEAVPKADVVVTNPTHFAVALKYEAGTMAAPTVVAKGADLMAQAIRELAAEHHVPLLEAPPLARALYRHAQVDEQIPAGLYTAVAEVMAYVYQLNHFLSQGGLPPAPPVDLPVPEGMDPGAPTVH